MPAQPDIRINTQRVRHFVIVLCALIVSTTSAFAADAKPDFAGVLPARVGTWKKTPRVAHYDRTSLYDYIDGGAELYLAFGFEGAVAIEYSAGKDDEIKVDIFDMGSPRGAFGAFAHGRESIAAEVGQGSEYAGGLLTFWKHRWFVSVLGYPETGSKRKAVYKLARAVAALIPETGATPAIVAGLPKPGLIASSVRTFHHPLLQNDYVTLSYENPLAIGPQTEAVLARYVRGNERYVLLLVDYATDAEAKSGLKGFSAGVLGGSTVGQKAGPRAEQDGGGWMGGKQSGTRLALVLDASSKAIVDRVLSEVP